TVTISCFKLGHQPNLILSDNKLSNQTLLRNLSPPKTTSESSADAFRECGNWLVLEFYYMTEIQGNHRVVAFIWKPRLNHLMDLSWRVG
ncbi:unnamed protein product, partial [Brassica oleracea]